MGSFASEKFTKTVERDEMTTRKEYTDREHLVAAFADLKEFRDADEFCDINLKVDNKEIKAHRVVLAASSPYFKNMFNARSLAAIAKVIDLPQQNFESVKNLVDFIYTGKIELDLKTVEEVYNTATFLELERVKTICSHFLKFSLNRVNCLAVWNIADNIGLEDLQAEAKKQSITTLDEQLSTDTFLNLCPKKIEDLIKETSEQTKADKVYRAIIAWVKQDLEKRKSNLGKLLQYVPPQKISRDFLRTTVIKETLLTEDLVCMNWMHQIFIALFDSEKSDMSQEESEFLEHAKGRIFVCSWRARDSIFYKFDPATSSLAELPARPRVRYSYPVLYEDSIYFTGGLVDSGCSNECNRFNLNNESWDVLPLECDRYYHGACVTKDSLYVVGGCRDLQNLNTVNIYDFQTGAWMRGPDMAGTRKFFGISMHNGCIYVTGGVTDKPTFSSSVERLDPREGIWHNIPRLGRTSGACSSAVVANMVYCSGFRSGVTERFETRLNRWEEISDAPGLSGRLVATKGELYRVAEEGLYQYGVYDNTWNNILDVKCFSTEIVALAD